MRILGVDPGLKITGYGVIECRGSSIQLLDGGIIRLSASEPLPHRLTELENALIDILVEFRPEICAIEQLYAHYKHPRTAILMAHGRGVVMLAAQRQGAKIEQYLPNRIKQSVSGNGHASKLQMQRAVQITLKMKALPSPPDVADALAVALCCARKQ
jgi:crossover junction endodeoxyribonuclease RuvC